MNFLSHYYHELPCDDPYFTAGLMLPDILSNYSHRAGKAIKLHPWRLAEPDSEKMKRLTEGVKQHYAVDAAFHPSDFFVQNTHFIRGLMADYPFTCFPRRGYAIEHILLEIILDRRLLNADNRVCDNMYAVLDRVEEHIVADLMELNGHNGHSAGAAQHFSRFRRQKFVYDYTFDERLVELIGHINLRLGNPPLTDIDRKHLLSLIYAIENALSHQKFPKFRTDS